MATMNITWTPGGSGNSVGQKILRIARIVGSVPNLTTTFTPANNLSTSQNNALAEGLLPNIVYRFKVQNLCTIGGPVDNSDGIKEHIKFECVPITFEVLKTTNLYCHVTLGQYLVIDGNVVASEPTSDLTGAEFSLYDSSNTTLLQGPVTGTLPVGYVPIATTTFTGLTPGTTYTVRYTLFATVNGVSNVRSDGVAYLNAPCSGTAELPMVNSTGVFKITNNTTIGGLSRIEAVPNFGNYYTISTGTIPVTAGLQVVGTHTLFNGKIVVAVNELDGTGGNVSLYVNGLLVETIALIPATHRSYAFAAINPAVTDEVEIILNAIV